MEHLVLVGGLQHSGKSTFCKNLESAAVHTYRHFDPDDSYEYLTFHRGDMMQQLKRVDRELYDKIKVVGWKQGVTDEGEMFTEFARAMIDQKELEFMNNLTSMCSLLYTCDQLKAAPQGTVPLVDCPMPKKDSRGLMYQVMRKALKDNTPLDDVKKMMVYFDLGLEYSLDRLRTSTRQEKKSMIITEDTLRMTHQAQEIPTTGELPNLEVLLLRNQKDVDNALKTVQDFCQA